MDLNTAFQVIKEASNIATTKGEFNMQDVATIVPALQTVSNAIPKEPEPLTKLEIIQLETENTK